MALSQIQCLDDNHVNPRTHESKPEFFYCEDQRLALEALLRDGREGFGKCLESRGLRGFLSDPELEVLVRTVEPYDPGCELFPEGEEDEPTPLSLHYWPEMSDTSIPHMDLGWPDSDGYRGVTRTTVYTQPPMEGQAHIKEVVRKMIAQAQKVIAVVMDVFTDVDIFRDLLDASFKRKVSVYILLERTALPHFLSMCQRANMHTGHRKNLRVRCTGGADFFTRSCTKIRGRMGHRFMFIDGDKAMSGSYCFTWMSSRLDRNLITVTTGQAVDGFDRLFRFLYATSSSVDLRQIDMEPEPEPDPLPQPTVVAPPSAAVARKLINPKYALVATSSPSPTTSVDSPKETQDLDNSKKNKRKKALEVDAPPLHPGLVDLEKACLISYLPTWPEPDPPSDVIGFINIWDTTRPTQVHLQRHEMFETSQAIRFSSPITKAKEILPEVAKPRQQTADHVELNKPQPAPNTTKAEEVVLLHYPSKHQRVQQPDSGASSPSRPPRPPRPLSATQPLGPRSWASRQLSQPEGKVQHGSFQVLDNASSRRRSPSRPAPPGAMGPVGSAAGRKQVPSSQQGLVSRQPSATQSRARAGQAQNQTQYPKPQASFLHSQSHLQRQTHSHPQKLMVSAEEAHGQDEGRTPFGFTFSRLYNLKGLKDKMSKLPTHSKRGSTSSPVQGNKSSS
uniref:Family with sequence similarity 83 member G n=1 Tax=Acanthochromis polyacanthus TaxID=80966 RepID=A0A3Q1EJW4_9TELE